MPDCECLKTCPYFEHDIVKQIDMVAKLRQQKFCKGDNSLCARYMVFKTLGKPNVPKDLLPTQTERAKEIIDKHKNLPKNLQNCSCSST
jgi:hypothetical protein